MYAHWLCLLGDHALVADKWHNLDECGIVEVEVRLIRWIKPQNLPYELKGDESWRLKGDVT